MPPTRSRRTPHVALDQRDPSTVRAVILARTSDPNAKDERIESQVEACEQFIAKMGWPPPVLGPFADKRSGFYNVERPALAEVERLIAQRAIDVVVCLNFERLARKQERRYAAIYLARKYGVEYRFAALEPDGKLADTMESRILGPVLEAYGELNREKIVENTKRGRHKRALMGVPTGGSGGPPFGFRKAVKDVDTTTYWAEEPREAALLREMYTWLDEHLPSGRPGESARGLLRLLNARDERTRRGKPWSQKTLMDKLRNPLYCGRGRLYRWQVVHIVQTNEATGEDNDYAALHKRDPQETLPIAPGMLPTLIDPALFDRVQAKLDQTKRIAGRVGRSLAAHPVEATLLTGGFVKCARCGGAMTRVWRGDRGAGSVYYRCSARMDDPYQPCASHSTPAAAVDELTLRVLAETLTDPEQVLALAERAQQRLARTTHDVAVATSRMEAMRARVAELDAETVKLTNAITALAQLAGMEETVGDLRAKVAALAVERARAVAEQARALPSRERVAARAAWLRNLFTQRDALVDFATGHTEETGEPRVTLHATLTLAEAAALLHAPQEQVARMAFPVWSNDPDDDEALLEVERADVVYVLLRQMPYAQLRQLLEDTEVRVTVAPPRTLAERQARGQTPMEERVVVHVGALAIQRRPARRPARRSGGTMLTMLV
ncbi:MAG TPA: recombinase family protein [Ktedonobacterales bacterium]|nr:recombinase family protein [Ktedonobacterales bacterium]